MGACLAWVAAEGRTTLAGRIVVVGDRTRRCIRLASGIVVAAIAASASCTAIVTIRTWQDPWAAACPS